MNLEEARKFWKVANKFPPDKEAVYPAHAGAHDFDSIKTGDRCLEYGCGGGSDTMSMLRRGASVTFVDIVPENVDVTRQRVAAGPRPDAAVGFVLEASDALPFEASLFDRINCHGVLHHIEEETMRRVIGEFYRILRPGGMLYAMLYTEKLFERCKKGIDDLCKAHGWPIDQAFSYMTDGGGIAREYTEKEGRDLFEYTVGVHRPNGTFADGFGVIMAVEYNNGDFRTYWRKKLAY